MNELVRMQWFIMFASLVVLLGVGQEAIVAQEEKSLSGEAKEAADELWRRGRCILSAVVKPAKRAAKAPPGVESDQVAYGRVLSMANEISSYAMDRERMWVATDSALFVVNAADGRQVRVYTPADGLPDAPIEVLCADKGFLWIVHRNGLSAVDLQTEELVTEDMPQFFHARLAMDGQRTWVISDAGTYVYSHNTRRWTVGPAIPSGPEIRALLERGIWEGKRFEALQGLLGNPVVVDGDVYVSSRGILYRLDGAAMGWSVISDDAWQIAAGDGHLCFMGAASVGIWIPSLDEKMLFRLGQEIPQGRPRYLVFSEGAFWLALDAQGLSDSYSAGKGGLARFDCERRQWTAYTEINGRKADQITALQVLDGQVWCATQDYVETETRVAHPGMAHIKRERPKVTGLSLHCYEASSDQWRTITMPMPEGESRTILGQRGTHNDGELFPLRVKTIARGERHLFCHYEMFPKGYYSGYYETIGLFAQRLGEDSEWTPSFVNHAASLDLQGEQPSVLLISESHGDSVVRATGHKRALSLFRHPSGRMWAVTEGRLAWFDESSNKWGAVVDSPMRFYWRATAAAVDRGSIWLGTDCGIVSCMDRKTYGCRPMVWLPHRKVVRMAFGSDGVLWVKTEKADSTKLPVQLSGVTQGPPTEAARFDGANWQPADAWPSGVGVPEPIWSFEEELNFLRDMGATASGEHQIYLAGVFSPSVLLEDYFDECLWISTYCGLVKLPISQIPNPIRDTKEQT